MATIKEIIENHRNNNKGINIENARRLGSYASQNRTYYRENEIALALSNTAMNLNNTGAKIFSARNFTSLEVLYDNHSKTIVLVPTQVEDSGGLYLHLSKSKSKPSVTFQSGSKGIVAFLSDIFKRDAKEYWLYHIRCEYDKENDAIVGRFANAKLSNHKKRVIKKNDTEVDE